MSTEQIIKELEKLEDEISQLGRNEARKCSATNQNGTKVIHYENYRAYEDAASSISEAAHFLRKIS